jgi:hypothetical protein
MKSSFDWHNDPISEYVITLAGVLRAPWFGNPFCSQMQIATSGKVQGLLAIAALGYVFHSIEK